MATPKLNFLTVLFLLTSFLAPFCEGQNLIADLRAKGVALVAPGDQGYENASAPFNHRFAFQPAAVTFPTAPEQVSEIVQTAAKFGKPVAPRSGGHSYVANGLGGQDGAVVVDMNRHFTQIRVDPHSNTALIEPGNRLGDTALTLNSYGRDFGHGTCPYIGIGGHVAYGGFGYASRLWGLALDAVLSMDVVLANGTITTASKDQNPELFWGLRGGGSSFAIITSITIKTFPVPPSATVFQYNWDLAAPRASSLLDAYQKFSLDGVPPEFGSELEIVKGSEKGKVNLTLQGVWFGPADAFSPVISPLLHQIGLKPQIQLVKPGSYIDSVAFFGEKGMRLNTTGIPDQATTAFYPKSLLTPESQPMTRESQDKFMEYLANEGFMSQLDWFIEVEEFGGSKSAVNAVPVDDTAFANRDALFLIQFYGSVNATSPPFPQPGFTMIDGMVNSITNNNPSNWRYTAYPNYVDDRLDNWPQLYFGKHYERLQRLKAVMDPANLFRFPTSIEEP